MENPLAKDKDDQKNGGQPGLSGEDRYLWDFVTRTIKPLSGSKTPRIPPEVKPALKPGEGEKSRLTSWLPSFGLKAPDFPDPGLPGGLDRRTSDRLRRGEFPIDARLDLHGLRQSEAQERLIRFVVESYESDRRCLLVITGKGNRFYPEQEAGILRRMLPVWIGMAPLAPLILTHSPAKPKDGGEGAFYILLRRRRL